MSEQFLSRRRVLTTIGASVGASMLPVSETQAAAKPVAPFTLCLNMSTIMGHKLGFVKELETASKAGFRSVEVWMNSLQAYLDQGGTLAEAKRILNDLGLKAENAIGFATWIVDDEAQRTKALDQLKREMEQLAAIGCPRTAAPPMGATKEAGLDLKKAAERFRTICELGDQTGVHPQLELWGHSKNLSRVSEVMYVAAEAGHSSARVLLDVFHLYKGGSSPNSLALVGKPAIEIFHVNDYPSLAPATIVDADRVYPGDGIAPIKSILNTIRNPDRPIVLSFEVFNKGYYAQDALVVAKTAFEKMKKMVA
jgi:2-keto-myo-inositol isomerase